MNTLVDVLVMGDDDVMTDEIAKITRVKSLTYIVKYFTKTGRFHGDRHIYNYENNVYKIDKESVSGYYDTKDEEDLGFIKILDGWVLYESDVDNYEPESEPDTESDESFTASDED